MQVHTLNGGGFALKPLMIKPTSSTSVPKPDSLYLLRLRSAGQVCEKKLLKRG